MGVLMMGFLHVYMKFTQPLFVQALMGIKNLVESNLFKLYILNKPAEGDLKRPFKAAPGFFGGVWSYCDLSIGDTLADAYFSWWPCYRQGFDTRS